MKKVSSSLEPQFNKSPHAFRTIREVSEEIGVPQHVLRFWETKFNQLRPLKRGGGRRYYRPEDFELVKRIRHLLYGEGYTIKGAQKFFKDDSQESETFIKDNPLPKDGVQPLSETLDDEAKSKLIRVIKELDILRGMLRGRVPG